MTKDPYRYFRVEARELVAALQAGALELERGADPPATVARLLRVAHTLKGAARVVRVGEVADLAHGVEDLLAPARAEPGPEAPPGMPGRIDRPLIEGLLGAADAISARLALLDAPRAGEAAAALGGGGFAAARTPDPTPAPAQPAPAPPPTREGLDAVRVPLRDLDRLLDQLLDLRARLAELARSGVDAGALDPLQRGLSALQGGVSELRLVPAAGLLADLQRVARDAAVALGKEVQLTARGGEVRLDAPVLRAIGEAMVQLVRNAVAHGIEAPAQRARAGKPATGRIEVGVERRGARVVFRCRDDGRGIDLEAIRQAALRAGRISFQEAAGLSMEAALGLLLRGGLSTAGAVSEVAGRGVGLDVVREALERVAGEVTLDSTPGAGTELLLEAPVSLAALDALAVEAGGARWLIPLDGVAACAPAPRPEPGATRRAKVVHQGAPLEVAPLAELVGGPPQAGARAGTLVVLEGRTGRTALAVDRLLGATQVVVRALPAATGRAPLVVGAAVGEDGQPVLVLDPPALIEAAAGERPPVPAPPSPYLPVLVIDDSLTTRMLEHTILTSAGYEVELATSAEEGLELARRREYGLFMVDVEMPGMSGFEYVARTRADPRLSQVPAVLVTSRNAREDRQRGLDAGASAYVVKSEFHEAHLLELVARLTRRGVRGGPA